MSCQPVGGVTLHEGAAWPPAPDIYTLGLDCAAGWRPGAPRQARRADGRQADPPERPPSSEPLPRSAEPLARSALLH